MLTIEQAVSEEAVLQTRRLFEEYSASVGVDLCFQDFARELETLPGDYTPPAGRLLLARDDEEAAGCIALRPIDGEICEMKRLYVRPTFRGSGLGRMLVDRIISEARQAGYRQMRLDSLPTMQAAISLYRRLGFRDIPSYRANPVPGAVFLELTLEPVLSDS
jgi:ribosomal protein S18 acetylase RimI-like enzyme